MLPSRSAEAKMKRLKLYFKIIKVALQTTQRALSKRHAVKKKWRPKRGPYQCGSPVSIVYEDNFKNFNLGTQIVIRFFKKLKLKVRIITL